MSDLARVPGEACKLPRAIFDAAAGIAAGRSTAVAAAAAGVAASPEGAARGEEASSVGPAGEGASGTKSSAMRPLSSLLILRLGCFMPCKKAVPIATTLPKSKNVKSWLSNALERISRWLCCNCCGKTVTVVCAADVNVCRSAFAECLL